MTDIAVVKALSLSNGVVGQWRKRKQNPSTEAIVKLSQFFNVTTDYLLCLTEAKTVEERYRINCPVADTETTKEANELVNVYQKLDVSGKRQLMGKAYELLDKKENAPAENDESEEEIQIAVPADNMVRNK